MKKKISQKAGPRTTGTGEDGNMMKIIQRAGKRKRIKK